jgi:hypothetical protein
MPITEHVELRAASEHNARLTSATVPATHGARAATLNSQCQNGCHTRIVITSKTNEAALETRSDNERSRTQIQSRAMAAAVSTIWNALHAYHINLSTSGLARMNADSSADRIA